MKIPTKNRDVYFNQRAFLRRLEIGDRVKMLTKNRTVYFSQWAFFRHLKLGDRILIWGAVSNKVGRKANRKIRRSCPEKELKKEKLQL